MINNIDFDILAPDDILDTLDDINRKRMKYRGIITKKLEKFKSKDFYDKPYNERVKIIR